VAKKHRTKKPKQQAKEDKTYNQELARHLAAIGVIKDPNVGHWYGECRAPTEREVRLYKQWCEEHGFTKVVDKTPRQRSLEVLEAKRCQVGNRLDRRKEYESNPRRTYQLIFRGKVSASDLGYATGPFQKISKRYSESSPEGRELLEELILTVDQHTDLLVLNGRPNDQNFIDAVLRLHTQHAHWVRSPKDWKPKSHNSERQLGDLARHLLAKYDMPLFMAKVWFAEDKVHWDWYKHIGRGENIRTAHGLPVELTKKMAHAFMKAPKECTICEAIRWGQVYGLGGDRRIAEGLRHTRICQGYGHEDFWVTVIRFFIRHPMLDTAHYNPIVDYLYHMRFVPRTRMLDHGLIERLPPEQPNLTMKDRDPETLVEQVEQWHARLAKETRYRQHNWEPSGIGEFYLEEGSLEKGTLRVWRIIELLTTEELRAEGNEMHHCAGSYSGSCAAGSTSIFSMTREVVGHASKRMLTIEVRRANRLVTQARGCYNALPEAKERTVLEAWARQENLQIAGYVLGRGW
jgi:hypothetical protein